MNLALLSTPPYSRKARKAFRDFKARVEADGGTFETPNETRKELTRLARLGLLDDDLTLAYVAGAYKAGKWYNIQGAGGDLDVVRATDAYRVNRPFALQSRGNNITATTYGTDGKLKGNYIRSALTNLFRDSEPTTDPGQGERTSVTFEVNDWNIGLDGKVVFGDNSIDRRYRNTASLPATTHSMAFLIKPNNGLVPTFGTGSTNITNITFGGNSVASNTTIVEVHSGIWLVKASGTIDASFPNLNGIRKLTTNNSVGFEVSALMIVAGDVDLTLEDYIKTVGSSAPRNADNISKTGISGLIGQTEGVALIRVDLSDVDAVSNGRLFEFNDGTTTNRTIFRKFTNTKNLILQVGSTVQIIGNYSGANSGEVLMLLRYDGTNFTPFLRGSKVNDYTLTAPSALSMVLIGTSPAYLADGWLNDRVKAFYHWKSTTKFTDEICQKLTTP